ncbi:hypothetical protein LCGC14_1752880 [marine sediment metagenome]|uniref:Uncharacterized protein n=1 Tax=marine sediment metagenome TaxID=412755 RepID=A0A0F9H3B5_9ZZZZ
MRSSQVIICSETEVPFIQQLEATKENPMTKRMTFLCGMLAMGLLCLVAVYAPDLFVRWYLGV